MNEKQAVKKTAPKKAAKKTAVEAIRWFTVGSLVAIMAVLVGGIIVNNQPSSDDGVIVSLYENTAIIYNSEEVSPVLFGYTSAMVGLMEENGFDSIIFGRVNIPINGGPVEFTTIDGKNPIPLESIISVLRKKELKATFAMVDNSTGMGFPTPVTLWTDGHLTEEIKPGIKFAGIGWSSPQTFIRSRNIIFEYNLEDNEMEWVIK